MLKKLLVRSVSPPPKILSCDNHTQHVSACRDSIHHTVVLFFPSGFRPPFFSPPGD